MRRQQAQPRLPAKANSDWRRLLRQARQAGWTVHPTRNQHIRLAKAGHPNLFLSLQSADPRALRNMKATLARIERNGHGLPR